MSKYKILSVFIILALAFSLVGQIFDVSARPLFATSPPLGDAGSFSVLAALSMDAAGAGTTVSGDLGLSPGLASNRTGGPWVVGGSEYFGTTGPSADAQAAALIAFGNLAGQASDGLWSLNPNPVPGVWTADSSAVFAGTLTLNGGPSDVWVFQIAQDLTFSGSVIFTGGANACNVFWQIGNSAIIGSGTAFAGTLIASADVSLVSGATVDGRLISLNSSLTTDGNTISGPICAAAPAATGTATATATRQPRATGTPGVGGLPNTGGAPIQNDGFPWSLVILGGLGAVALTLGVIAYRRDHLTKK